MKDPAFLFYSNDFLSGTILMNNEEIGIYIKLLCIQHQQGHLKEEDMISMGANDKILNKFIKDDKGFYYNLRLETEANKRQKFVESRREARKKCDEDQVRIYMILDKDTNYIKIGSSVNPKRRFAEMCNQKNPAITVGNRNYELIFVSKVLERKIEKELHKLYENKNITGEWFALEKEDINYIRKTYEDTYEQRTENENINESINDIENKNEDNRGMGEEEKDIEILEVWETQFNDFYSKYPRKVKKQDVKKWFQKNKPSSELFSSMMSSLEQFRGAKDWLKDNGQYIPYPSTWLNQKRWEDEGIETTKISTTQSFEQRQYDDLSFLIKNFNKEDKTNDN